MPEQQESSTSLSTRGDIFKKKLSMSREVNITKLHDCEWMKQSTIKNCGGP